MARTPCNPTTYPPNPPPPVPAESVPPVVAPLPNGLEKFGLPKVAPPPNAGGLPNAELLPKVGGDPNPPVDEAIEEGKSTILCNSEQSSQSYFGKI